MTEDTLEATLRLVRRHSYGLTPDQERAVAEHAFETGDSIWHAAHVVLKTSKCFCANCAPTLGMNR